MRPATSSICRASRVTRHDVTSPGSPDPLRLAATFAEVADALAAEQTTEATLDKICGLAVGAIPACDHCGVSVLERGSLVTASSSDAVCQRLDELQNETRQGPAVDALRHHEVVQVDRLSGEQRWPLFARRAAKDTGVESALVFPVFSVSGPLGVLHLYARTPGALQAQASPRSVGSVIAAHVAVALIQARRVEQLEEAIETRNVIGQAIGILMVQEHLTADQGFERLRDMSQRLNRKLRDIAEEITYTGRAPQL